MMREQARVIATQHSYFNRKYGRKTYKPEPLDFGHWFLKGVRTFEAKGAEFELLPGMVKIVWPGRPAILRTLEDLRREYETEYLSKF